MSEFNPAELPRDELFLDGRIQFAVAHAALVAYSQNNEAIAMLGKLLDLHATMMERDEKAPLAMFISGETTEATKADIIASLQCAETDEKQPSENKVNARALLDVLGADRPDATIHLR